MVSGDWFEEAVDGLAIVYSVCVFVSKVPPMKPRSSVTVCQKSPGRSCAISDDATTSLRLIRADEYDAVS